MILMFTFNGMLYDIHLLHNFDTRIDHFLRICNPIRYKIAICRPNLIVSCLPEMNPFNTQVIQHLSRQNSQSSSGLNYKGPIQAKRYCGISQPLFAASWQVLKAGYGWVGPPVLEAAPHSDAV